MEEYVNTDNICINCMKKKQTKGVCEHCGFDETSYHSLAHQLPPRHILNGKYMIGKVLGEGGFGITYLGYDLNLEIPLAIKEYFPSGFVARELSNTASVYPYGGDATELFQSGKSKFIDEARKLAKFQNLTSIVSVRDYFQENQTAYIVMEYLEGTDLKHYLSEHEGHLTQQEILSIMKPLILSLEKIHASGIIHRDISPDNIMVMPDGSVKLIDFGAAKNIDEGGEQSKTVSVKNGYAPKEQYLSHGMQGPWTDVYALCATMYKCFSGLTPPQSLERMGNDQLIQIHDLNIAMDARLEQVLMKGLSVEREDRYQSMQELYQAIYGEMQEDDLDKTVYIPKTSNDDTEERITVSVAHKERKKLDKRIWFGISAAAVILCVILLVMQPWKSAEPVAAVKKEPEEMKLVKKDHGNFMQEHFYVDDNRVYSYFNHSLLRTSKGTNSDIKIFLKDTALDAFSAYKNDLFVISNKDHYLYQIDTETNVSKRISTDDMSKASMPLAYKGKLYYLIPQAVDSTMRSIVCVDMETQEYRVFPNSKGYTNLTVEDDVLYYMSYDGTKTQIGSISLRNQKETLLCEKEGSPLVLAVDNKQVFASYLDSEKQTIIFTRNLVSNKETEILKSTRMIGGFAIDDQHTYIYYLYLNSDMKTMKGMYRASIQTGDKHKSIYTSGDERMVSQYGSDKLYFPSAANYYVMRMNLDGSNQEQWITCKDKIIDIQDVDEYLYVMTEKDIYWVKFNAGNVRLGYSDSALKKQNQDSANTIQKVDELYSKGQIRTVNKGEVAVPENQLQYKITSVSRSATSNTQKAAVRVKLEVSLSEARDTSMLLRKDTFLIRTLSGKTATERNKIPVNVMVENKSRTLPIALSAHTLYNITLEYTIPAEENDYYIIMSNLDETYSSKGPLYVSHFKKSNAFTSSVSTDSDSSYILNNSNTKFLQDSDIRLLNSSELMLARNEIYARHGRKFQDEAIRNYFLKKTWYHPCYEPTDFDKKVTLNTYEKANIEFIVKQEAVVNK